MQIYANRGGDSGVRGYEIEEDCITVWFTSGSVYTYTYASAGEAVIRELCILAKDGHGLNSYLSKNKPQESSKS